MKVISLINMKGGVGKTTLSVNISDCIARRHNHKVLLIDIDPQFNATQCLMTGEEYEHHLINNGDTILNVFEREGRKTVSTVQGVQESSSKKLSEIQPIEVSKNFYLLPGNLELYRIEMSPGEGRENRLNKFLKALAVNEDFDTVIIDTPPTPSIWMTSALLASDYYLIPVKPEPLSFTGIDLLESIITYKKENLDLSIECVGIVLTMVEAGTIVHRNALQFLQKGRWKGYKFKKELPKRTEIARSQMTTFILDLSDNEAKVALSGIVDELLQRIEE